MIFNENFTSLKGKMKPEKNLKSLKFEWFEKFCHLLSWLIIQCFFTVRRSIWVSRFPFRENLLQKVKPDVALPLIVQPVNTLKSEVGVRLKRSKRWVVRSINLLVPGNLWDHECGTWKRGTLYPLVRTPTSKIHAFYNLYQVGGRHPSNCITVYATLQRLTVSFTVWRIAN